jgi:predicted nuclease with RNAse H fold
VMMLSLKKDVVRRICLNWSYREICPMVISTARTVAIDAPLNKLLKPSSMRDKKQNRNEYNT